MTGGWLAKSVLTPRHQLRQPPAWACDVAHLDHLERENAHGVRLTDEHGNVWSATLQRFRDHGIPIDRGFGPQVALPLTWWTVQVAGQLSFFGEVA